MNTHNQRGAVHTSVLVAGVMSVLFFFTLIATLLLFMTKADLQKKFDTKVDEQVAAESKVIEAKKDAELAEKEKSPVKTFTGPSTAGSVTFTYPKTYSTYVTSGNGLTISAYFQPDYVPVDDSKTQFALRMAISSQSYDAVLRSFDNLIKGGKLKASAFSAKSVPSVVGTRLDGTLTATGKQGTEILLPIRDKTLLLWSESPDGLKDFETYVLPSITFIP